VNGSGVKRVALLFGAVIATGVAAIIVKHFVRESPEPGEAAPLLERSALGPHSFTHRTIGRPTEGNSWITDVLVVDLDADGRKDIVACDGQRNEVVWIRQMSPGEFAETTLGESIAGPAHVEVADLNADGHLDVLVASMGVIPPSNMPTGSVVVLVNDGTNHFSNRVLLEDVARVTYVAASDFNKDGRLDLIVGHFGYVQGGIRWMENRGDWMFESHVLLDLPGTIHAPVTDFDGDGDLDVIALVSQDSEEVHAFFGDGTGNFTNRILHGSTNKDHGCSGLVIADVNSDGRPDVVYTNGDGFDYATPGSRPWHGVQWLENLGSREVAYHRIGDFPGAYSPAVIDIDADGDNDIIACSAFNDWSDPNAVSLMVFEREGARFTPRPLASVPTHLIAVRAADLCGDGRSELVTGAMMFYPPFEHASRVSLWEVGK
jgi:hypothetical protein